MSVLSELREMAGRIARETAIPRIRELYLPPLADGPQPVEHEFLVMALEGGAAGLSFVLLPKEAARDYRALRPAKYAGTPPEDHLGSMGGGDPVGNMIGLAAVNAICQHVMRSGRVRLDLATDSLGLLDIRDGDRIGMVGLFGPLLRRMAGKKIDLVVVEKDETLVERHPELDVTLDATRLRDRNKVLCTSTTVLNDTIDEVLANCTAAEHVGVIGPTAGFLPDPLFARGVHVVGSRYVVDGDALLARVRSGERWGDATRKLCFRRETYEGSAGGS